ncbi:cell division protein SepF [Christensenellaceae bacterium OttesenSCG-928-M15]|nr:cell division protein SepF [Christensenellaceae bacterium OttesenSCG-928-M15]
MAKFFSKFLDYIGIEETEMEEGYQDNFYNDDELEEPDSNIVSFSAREKRKANSNVVSMPAASQMKMIVYHPISYEDTQNIIDNLKSRKPVIVNMEDLEVDCAQRVLDFMVGAVYALNGTIFKISRGIFVVAPINYDVIGNGEGELGDEALI